jgi:hypothetical protein
MEIFGHKLLDEIGVKEADRRLVVACWKPLFWQAD